LKFNHENHPMHPRHITSLLSDALLDTACGGHQWCPVKREKHLGSKFDEVTNHTTLLPHAG
jgi:hypothetical protein